MPKELPKQYYELMFIRGGVDGAYHKGPEDSFMISLWGAIADAIPPGSRVADFGCGAGQLARLLRDRGFSFQYGVDITERGLELARKLNPGSIFFRESLYVPEVFGLGEYDVAIFCEVLEHLDDDLAVLHHLPAGKSVVISVPTAESKEHVRCFPFLPDGIERVKEYYGQEIEIDNIGTVLIPINNPGNEHYWYIITGRKR